MKIFAHRGASAHRPENSIEALSYALNTEIDGIEFDVAKAKDGAVVIHEETFYPDADFKALKPVAPMVGSSWVLGRSINELTTLDMGAWFDPPYADLRVATLGQILSLDWGEKIALIEIKDPLYCDSEKELDFHRDFVDAVEEDLRNFIARGQTAYILSFSPHIISEFAKRKTGAKLVQLAAEFDRYQALLTSCSTEVSAFTLGESLVLKHPEAVEMGHVKGKSVFVYEHTDYRSLSNEEKLIERRAIWPRLISLGIDGLISNFAAEFAAQSSNR